MASIEVSSQEDSPEVDVTALEADGFDITALTQQVNNAQTVLLAMQADCPRNRYTEKFYQDIDELIVDCTIVLSINMAEEMTDAPEDTTMASYKAKVTSFFKSYEELRELHKHIMAPRVFLEKKPSDESVLEKPQSDDAKMKAPDTETSENSRKGDLKRKASDNDLFEESQR